MGLWMKITRKVLEEMDIEKLSSIVEEIEEREGIRIINNDRESMIAYVIAMEW